MKEITINKNGKVLFNAEFNSQYASSISRIDDFIIIRFDKKKTKVRKNEKYSNAES